MKKPEITVDDWLAELERLCAEQPDGISSHDIADRTGRSQAWAQGWLRQRVLAGTWEYVGKRSGSNIAGGSQPVPVYRPVKKGEAK